MGLDTSHDCWHGAYSAFDRWRTKLAEVAGLPPLDLMAGFYAPLSGGHVPTLYHGLDTRTSDCLRDIDARLPIRWDALKPDILHRLLHHSDCDGILENVICAPLADRLEELLPLLPDELDPGHIGIWKKKTQQFINGLRAAATAGEDVEFY